MEKIRVILVWLVILTLLSSCSPSPTSRPQKIQKEEIVVAPSPESVQQVAKPTLKPVVKKGKPVILSVKRDDKDEDTWHIKVNKVIVEMAKKNRLEVHILAGYVYFNADITRADTSITLGWTPPDSELTVGVYNPDTGKYLVSAFVMEEE